MRFKNPFRFCLWSICSQAKKRRSRSLRFNWYGTQFSCFWIIPMALRRFEMACWVTPNDSDNYSCVWNKSAASNASNSEASKMFFFSTAIPVLDIKITALEVLKPVSICSVTKSSVTLSTWEHLMSLSRSFLQMKAENQNFPQITRIWLEN